MAIINRVAYNLRGSGAPERLQGIAASHDLPQVLGVRPLLGRGFIEEDDRPGGRNDVVILTEELWRSRFGGDASIVNTQHHARRVSAHGRGHSAARRVAVSRGSVLRAGRAGGGHAARRSARRIGASSSAG